MFMLKLNYTTHQMNNEWGTTRYVVVDLGNLEDTYSILKYKDPITLKNGGKKIGTISSFLNFRALPEILKTNPNARGDFYKYTGEISIQTDPRTSEIYLLEPTYRSIKHNKNIKYHSIDDNIKKILIDEFKKIV